MEAKRALNAITWISLAGMLFSGYLSYTELASHLCALGGGCQSLLGIPTCVYGFVMYLVIFIFCLLGNEGAMIKLQYALRMHKFYK